MSNESITDLTELTVVDDEDMLAVVDDPAGTPTTMKAKANAIAAGGLYDHILLNLIYNNPGQIVTDGSEPQWWDDSADATLTDEDAAGEACTDKTERVFKLVTISDDKYGYSTYQCSDEELLDEGATVVSLGVWVWCSAANTASIGIYGPNTGLTESDQHPGDSTWQLLTIENVSVDAADTYLEVRLIADTGTAFFGRMSLVVGPKAVMLRPRELFPVQVQQVSIYNANPTGDIAWADLDLTANSDPLAVKFQVIALAKDPNDDKVAGTVSHDDVFGADKMVVRATNSLAGHYGIGTGVVFGNDGQVVRHSFDEADADNDGEYTIWLTMYWMWE